jgi:hypothetical protein
MFNKFRKVHRKNSYHRPEGEFIKPLIIKGEKMNYFGARL